MYKEIQVLYQWCQKMGVQCTIEPLFDGYKIQFADGADMVQHRGSYGSQNGYIEPAGFGEEDYSAVELIKCWKLIQNRYR